MSASSTAIIDLPDVLWSPAPSLRPGVLVAVPDPAARDQLAALFGRDGYRVWQAADGPGLQAAVRVAGADLDAVVAAADLPGLPPVDPADWLTAAAPGLACCLLGPPSDGGAGVTVLPARTPPAAVVARVRVLAELLGD